MAPLPRYTPAGITIAAPQPVSPAADQAAASLGRNISASLTQMSNFAFRQAMQQAAVEGAEYGADKAPTIEQIKQAQEDGDPVNVPGDTTTVFGRAARQAALTNMKLNVESAARNELAVMHANVIKTEVPADQYAAQMNNLIKGYGDAIATASPSAAGAVRASLATIASMQYKVHATQLAARAEKKRKVAVGMAIENIIENAPNIVKAGDQFEDAFEVGDQVFIPSEAILASERNKILKLAYSIGDDKLRNTALTKFNEKIISAKKNLMSEYVKAEDGSLDYSKHEELWSNKITDPQKAAIWNSLDAKQKQDVRDDVIRASKQRTAVEENRMQYLEKKTKTTVNDLEMKMIIAIDNDDPIEQGRILNEFQKLNAKDQFVKYSNMIQEGATWKSNTQVLEHIKQTISFGLGRREDIFNAMKNRIVSPKDATALFNSLAASQNDIVKKFSEKFRKRIGYESDPMAKFTMSESKYNIAKRTYNAFSADLQELLEKSIREGKVFDPTDFYEKTYKKWQDENAEDDKKVSTNLPTLEGQLKGLTRFGITPPNVQQLSDGEFLKNLAGKIEANKGKMPSKTYITFQSIVKERRKQISGK